MANELLKSVMNNIANKNLDSTDYNKASNEYKNTNNYINNTEDRYERQKKLSLSKYSSSKQNVKVKDLNDLADEIRGTSREKTNERPISENRSVNTNNRLTLDDLSRQAGGKSDKDVTSSTINMSYTNSTDKSKFSLDSLTEKIKKNI